MKTDTGPIAHHMRCASALKATIAALPATDFVFFQLRRLQRYIPDFGSPFGQIRRSLFAAETDTTATQQHGCLRQRDNNHESQNCILTGPTIAGSSRIDCTAGPVASDSPRPASSIADLRQQLADIGTAADENSLRPRAARRQHDRFYARSSEIDRRIFRMRAARDRPPPLPRTTMMMLWSLCKLVDHAARSSNDLSASFDTALEDYIASAMAVFSRRGPVVVHSRDLASSQ